MRTVSPAAFAIGKQAGFTLIEIFIAILLLTIGLLGTAALTTGVVRGNVQSRNLTTATAIAHTCFEENRRVGYTNAGTVPAGGANNCVTGSSTVTAGGGSLSRELGTDAAGAKNKNFTLHQ